MGEGMDIDRTFGIRSNIVRIRFCWVALIWVSIFGMFVTIGRSGALFTDNFRLVQLGIISIGIVVVGVGVAIANVAISFGIAIGNVAVGTKSLGQVTAVIVSGSSKPAPSS